MAQSSYIYVVLRNGKLHSAFTVKHELVTSLPEEEDDGEFQILRLRDGVRFDDKQLADITNELMQ